MLSQPQLYTLVEVTGVRQHPVRHAAARAYTNALSLGTTQKRDLLIVRLRYGGNSWDAGMSKTTEVWCDEKCMEERTFTGSMDDQCFYPEGAIFSPCEGTMPDGSPRPSTVRGNLNGALKEASYNQLEFDPATSRIVTVDVGVPVDDEKTPWSDSDCGLRTFSGWGCNFENVIKCAEPKLREQFGAAADPDNFWHVEYVLPVNEQGLPEDHARHQCFGINIAITGIPDLDPNALRVPGMSKTIISTLRPGVRLHEFGHTWGLHHSGRFGLTGSGGWYGDKSSIMGTSERYTLFTAPHRLFMGCTTPGGSA
jgi:hypothetical protein